MVSDANAELPAPGDAVEIKLATGRVKGTVLESYSSGAQPRVLIELDDSFGERSTVALPPASLEPADTNHSPWAEGRRYERAFEKSLRRLFPDVSIETPSRVIGARYDFLLTFQDSRIVVELKYLGNDRTRAWSAAINQVRRAADEQRAAGLLVTNSKMHAAAVKPKGIFFVKWHDDGDDLQLRNTVKRIFSYCTADQ